MCLISFSKNKRYSSLKKIEEFDNTPKWAYINITNKCSHKCPWCYNKSIETNHITLSEYREVLSKLKDIGIHQITITGGEPLEHPNFLEIIELSKDFPVVHLCSNGDLINERVVKELKINNVKQVQFNYQGSGVHNQIHGTKHNSYKNQIKSIKMLKEANIEVVATITVAKYNFDYLDKIVKEIDELEIERFRFWEVANHNNFSVNSKDLNKLFKKYKEIASSYDYNYELSYDPLYDSDIKVACPHLSNMYIYINSKGEVMKYCPAKNNNKPLISLVNNKSKDIFNILLNYNESLNKKFKDCCYVRKS